ncbi:ubiquitin fusion degradation protein (Ufd1) [Paramyrothecium foliicola]|nr:ubiquitin fusion degradation protein (Ufd1) [Paramyrothecium foliicola]
MSQVAINQYSYDHHHHHHHHTTLHDTAIEIPPLTLLDTLHNSIVLSHTVAHLPIASLLNLAASSRAFRDLLYHAPGVFRHLDLSHVRTAQFDIDDIDRGGEVWRNVQVDENLTEDDFYSGPLRGIFATLARRNILQNVQTLVLDGLSVTAELCHEIINDPAYNVRILSIRDVKNLNQAKLRGALQYACRPGRPEATPRLKALYVFGAKEPVGPASQPATSISAGWNQKSQIALSSALEREGDAWWSRKGRILPKNISEDWASCLLACQGIIAFDGLLCTGPRHHNSAAFGKVNLPGVVNSPAVACFALPPCSGCGIAPEGMFHPKAEPPSSLPLLSPPPTLSSSVRAATTPQHATASSPQTFAPRCLDCIRERYCTACNKWWCESCYALPGQGAAHNDVVVVDEEGDWNLSEGLESELATLKIKSRVSKSCWECGTNCDDCIARTQRVCKKCYGGYCITHNEGSSATCCDWCVSSRRIGRL